MPTVEAWQSGNRFAELIVRALADGVGRQHPDALGGRGSDEETP